MNILRKIRPLLAVVLVVVLAGFATAYIFKFFNRASLEKALNGQDGFSMLFVVNSAADEKKTHVISVVDATHRSGVFFSRHSSQGERTQSRSVVS
jgi:uncharacterized caspase-like protein